MKHCQNNEITDAVTRTLKQYFSNLDGEAPAPVYDMVMSCVDKSILQFVLGHAANNQSVAAQMLGISRNTLRRKLANYGLL